MTERWQVWENQLTLIADDLPDRTKAVEVAKAHHREKPDRYHEVFRFEPSYGKFIGVAQWKPGDRVGE